MIFFHIPYRREQSVDHIYQRGIMICLAGDEQVCVNTTVLESNVNAAPITLIEQIIAVISLNCIEIKCFAIR